MVRGLRIFCFSVVLGAGFQACATSNGFAQISWTRTLDAAKSQAAHGNKLIIVDLYATWCPWCKKMDAETWPDPEVVSLQSKYVFLRLDAEKEPDGIALRQKFGITGFPTVVVLNADGGEFDRLQGYLPGKEFIRRLNSVVTDPNSLGNLKAAEVRDPKNLSVRFKLATRLFDSSDYEGARQRIDLILKQDPADKTGLKANSLFYLALCQASEGQKEPALATIEQLRKQYPSGERVAEASLLSGEILFDLGRREEARARIEEFLKKYPAHRMVPDAKRMLARM